MTTPAFMVIAHRGASSYAPENTLPHSLLRRVTASLSEKCAHCMVSGPIEDQQAYLYVPAKFTPCKTRSSPPW